MGGGTSKAETKKSSKLVSKRRAGTDDILIPIFGVANSGKSTVFNTLRISKAGGIPDNHRYAVRKQMHQVILLSLADALQDVKCEDDFAGEIIDLANDKKALKEALDDKEKTENIMALALKAWEMKEVQEIVHNADRWTNHFSMMHIFGLIEELRSFDYSPSNDDVLKVRMPTRKENELSYSPEGKDIVLNFRDYGGQRKLRPTWMKAAKEQRENKKRIPAVIFVLALDSFIHRSSAESASKHGPDMDFQDRKEGAMDQNLMTEALSVLELIATKIYYDSNVIIFLNKVDLLRGALAKKSINCVFPSYEGQNSNGKVIQLLKQVCREKCGVKAKVRSEAEVEFVVTNATDLDIMEKTLTSIQNTITAKILSKLFL